MQHKCTPQFPAALGGALGGVGALLYIWKTQTTAEACLVSSKVDGAVWGVGVRLCGGCQVWAWVVVEHVTRELLFIMPSGHSQSSPLECLGNLREVHRSQLRAIALQCAHLRVFHRRTHGDGKCC